MRTFAESVRKVRLNQLFAYNCSPSFNWKHKLDDATIAKFQVAGPADANSAGTMYPDQSLYPVDSVPGVVRRINNAVMRAGSPNG